MVPKKWPGALPSPPSVATRTMLKLPGMKNAPPSESFVTTGSLVVAVAVTVHASPFCCTGTARASSSSPLFRSSPTFASWSRKPVEGRTVRGSTRSLTVLS